MDLCPGCDRPENDHDPRCFMLKLKSANRPSALSAGLSAFFLKWETQRQFFKAKAGETENELSKTIYINEAATINILIKDLKLVIYESR